MKIYKRTIISMIILCLVSLNLSIILEFDIFGSNMTIIINHGDFLKNILLGVFASGLLVLIPSIVSYVYVKKEYYVSAYLTCNQILISALELITLFEKNSQDKKELNYYSDHISIKFNEVTSSYSNFTYFFKINNKDRLIESILVELKRYILVFEQLIILSKELKINKISETGYVKAFEVIRKEMLNTYRPEFLEYKKMIDEDMRSIVEDRVLKKYY